MLRHIVVLRWSEEATASQKRTAEAGFATLPESIPQIRALRCGPDLGLGSGNHHFAAVLDFDTVDDWRTYQASTAHQDFVTRCLKPILADRAAIQFDV